MTDNEIIKAFEMHLLDNRDCELCPYGPAHYRCDLELLKDALDLINRQKAEIERLQNKLSTVRQDLVATIPIIKEELKTAKTEAYKEFAKFLIDKSQNSTISISDLPDYVAEMEGGASEVEN